MYGVIHATCLLSAYWSWSFVTSRHCAVFFFVIVISCVQSEWQKLVSRPFSVSRTRSCRLHVVIQVTRRVLSEQHVLSFIYTAVDVVIYLYQCNAIGNMSS